MAEKVRRIRPTEVKAVLALLEADHEDVEELAKDICRTINALRASEDVWVRVVRDGSGYVLYGTYRTAEEARRDLASTGSRRAVTADDIRLYRLVPAWGVTEPPDGREVPSGGR